MSDRQFTYFSTFTGIGGFEVGIHNAYGATHGRGEADQEKSAGFWSRLFSTKRKSTGAAQRSAGPGNHDRADQRPLCVGYSEIDRFASAVYEKHFKGVKNYGDITKINAEELPDFDCLVGGFPCQAFSIAGKRAGFADTRGTLFFDLARILKAKQPRLFVFENVKGLLNHDGGNTIKTIISACDELGYDLQWQVLNSKNFGVPQNRERIIIVGHLRGSTRPEIFPITGSNANNIREITQSVPQSQRVYDESGIAPTVDAGAGGNRQAKIIQRPRGKNAGNIHDISPTVTVNSFQDNNHLIDLSDLKIRKLTPLECERLQAFPDGWTQYGMRTQPDGYLCMKCEGNQVDSHGLYCKYNYVLMSDTQRYKMAGNAVTTNVIQAVFERIFA